MEKQFKRFSLWGMLYLCITLTACSDNEEEFHSYLVADSKSESLFANGINVDAGDILLTIIDGSISTNHATIIAPTFSSAQLLKWNSTGT